MRPDEQPNDAGGNVTDMVQVAVVQNFPLACFTPENASTWERTDQFLSAGCSTTGPALEYSWRFDSPGSFTTPSPDTLFEFAGHTMGGMKPVTLKVTNTTTNLTDSLTTIFDVTNSVLDLNGPTPVTNKLLKTYTASANSTWFERHDPATNLNWLLVQNNGATYNRIWPGGQYAVALRAGRTVSGVLRRARLDIQVCTGCGPMRGPVASGAIASAWGIFGAGPWISSGGGNLARSYDLTGLHELGSPFASADWLDASGGTAEDAAGRWSVTWTKRDLDEPDALTYDFEVVPLGGDTPLVFGMAVDPDLGARPDDDVSGYDSRRGMVYVTGAGEAVGFLIRSGKRSALAGAAQYGVEPMAPRLTPDAWAAQREPGIRLLSGPGDVQLLLSADESDGTGPWTFVVVRGPDLSAIQAVADRTVKELRGK